MKYKELIGYAQELEDRLKNIEKRVNVPSQESTVAKQVKELQNFGQQRSHLVQSIMPQNSEGIDGEVRILNGEVPALIAKIEGIWKTL